MFKINNEIKKKKSYLKKTPVYIKRITVCRFGVLISMKYPMKILLGGNCVY